MITHRTYRIYCGIDPGVNTGLALWDVFGKKFIYIKSLKIHEAIFYIESHVKPFGLDCIVFKVEDARKETFGRNSDKHKAQGAGSVKRDSKIWDEYLTSIGATFLMLRRNPDLTNWTSEKFKMVSGWKEPTNEHGRSAAMLVINS